MNIQKHIDKLKMCKDIDGIYVENDNVFINTTNKDLAIKFIIDNKLLSMCDLISSRKNLIVFKIFYKEKSEIPGLFD